MNAYRAHLRNESLNTADPAYEPPPEPEYFLRGISLGTCPWCKARVTLGMLDLASQHIPRSPAYCEWDVFDTETENRIRYAAERLADAQVRQP